MSGIASVRAFLVVQIAIFVSAASMHFGLLFDGYRHPAAGTAESVIAAILLLGLALTWARAPWARRAPIGAQAFGILGVLVGLVTIAIGVGPRTGVDFAYHALMLVALIVGVAFTIRGPSAE